MQGWAKALKQTQHKTYREIIEVYRIEVPFQGSKRVQITKHEKPQRQQNKKRRQLEFVQFRYLSPGLNINLKLA